MSRAAILGWLSPEARRCNEAADAIGASMAMIFVALEDPVTALMRDAGSPGLAPLSARAGFCGPDTSRGPPASTLVQRIRNSHHIGATHEANFGFKSCTSKL